MGLMKSVLQFHEEAEFLRQSSGSTNIEKTLLKALQVLKLFEIPHFICGGFAVQEHGFPRYTVDIDIIVPDVQFAREKLAMNGFIENTGSNMTVTDRETRVEVDVLPGGGKVGPGPVTFPMPTTVSDEPQVLTLAELISLKLSSYIGSPFHRGRDYGDAIELIKANGLPREYHVDPRVCEEYHRIWDGLHQPSKIQ